MSVRASTSRWKLLIAAALGGAAVMVLELTAVRALAPHFGSSLYTWTNVIGVVLVALAGGYWLGGRLADSLPDPRRLGKILLVAAALSLPAPFLVGPLGSWLLPEPSALSPFVATGHIVRGSLAITLLLFAAPVFLMGMIGPFVTRCLEDTGLGGGTAAGRTLAVSTLGSLVGTYLPAHLLIENVGVKATLLFAPALLAAAGVLLISTRPGLVVGAGVLCCAGVLGRYAMDLPVRGPLVGDPGQGREIAVLEEIESAYQYIRVSRWETGTEEEPHRELRLSLDEGVTEFHSVTREGELLTGAYYDVFALLPELFADRSSAPPSVFVVGGGAGTMPRLLREIHGAAVGPVVNVEIDPAVAALSERFGWVPSGEDRLVVGDGRFALATTNRRFDLIILDAYARQIAIPAHLGTREFFALARAHMTPGGVLAINVSTPNIEGPLFTSLVKTLREVFPALGVVSVPDAWNAVLLASPDPERSWEPTGEGPPELDIVRLRFRQGLVPVPEAGPDAVLLVDDAAPLEQLARLR